MKIEITINIAKGAPEEKPTREDAKASLDEMFYPSFAALDALIQTLKGGTADD